MRTLKVLFLISILTLTTVHSKAEEWSTRIGLNVSAATNGVGGGVYWLPTERWKVSLNGEYMPSLKFDGTIRENEVTVDVGIRYKTGGVFLTGGYQFLPWMYGTAGVGINFFDIKAAGIADEIQFGDIVLKPETVGELSYEFASSAKVSPYLAVGFGRQAPTTKRVACAVEIGAYYMGAPKLEVTATGMLKPTEDSEHVKKLEKEFSQFKFYPMVKVILTVNLFEL